MGYLKNVVFKRSFLVIVTIVGIAGASLGLLFVPLVVGSGNEKRVVQEQDWSYTLLISNSTLEDVVVDYDFKNAASVERYAKAMHRENKALFASGTKQVMAVSIVFRRPLSWDEADNMVKRYQLTAGDYEYRIVSKSDPNNRYVYSLGMTRDAKTGKGFSSWARDTVEKYIADEHKGETIFKGIIGMKANLDAQEYDKISADPDVYLVDMPGVIIKAKLVAQAKPELRGFKLEKDFELPKASPQLYRDLEDFGLEGKKP